MKLCKQCTKRMNKAWKIRCETGKRNSYLCRKCTKKFIEEAKPIYGSCKFLKTWKPKPLPDYMKSDTKWFLPNGSSVTFYNPKKLVKFTATLLNGKDAI